MPEPFRKTPPMAEPLKLNLEFKERLIEPEEIIDPADDLILKEAQDTPDWLKTMATLDVIALPFSDIPFQSDFYEKALLMLMKNRKWGYRKLNLLFYLIVSPLMWMTIFPYRKKIRWTTHFLRWPINLSIPFAMHFGFSIATHSLDFGFQLIPMSLLGIIGYVLIYTFVTYESFAEWRQAHHNLKTVFQKIKLKNKKLKKKKKKKIVVKIQDPKAA